MTDILLDLVLRPGEHEHAPVQARLTLVAAIGTLLGGNQPGEIGGHVVPAEMVRALALALGLLPDPGSAMAAPAPVPADGWTAADERWWAEVEARALRGEWGGEDEPPPEVMEEIWAREAAWFPPEDLDAHRTPDHPAADRSPDTSRACPREHADLTTDSHPAAHADQADHGADGSPGERETPGPSGATIHARPARDREPALRDATGSSAATTGGGWAAADLAVDDAGAALLDLDHAVARARRAVADARRADALDEHAHQLSAAGRISATSTALDALAAATDAQRAALTDLLLATAGGGLADRPRIAVVDELTGALLALTDAPELRRAAQSGSGLGPPPPTDGYRPGARLDRYVRARDRRCRQPGCRRPVGELDHGQPYPDGPTAAHNLTGFCTGHHRGKHQAPGWSYHRQPDGSLAVTTPSGLTATTTPPPY